jgi:hypothetical protein
MDDEHLKPWPPHLKLLYPFTAACSETRVMKDEYRSCWPLKEMTYMRIQEAVKHVEPFIIALTKEPPKTHMSARTDKSIRFYPSGDSLHELRARLQTEFMECGQRNGNLAPYLTSHDNIREDLWVVRHGVVVAAEWQVDKVFVVERKCYGAPFEVVGSIPLGVSEV